MKLRPYQEKILDDVLAAATHHRRILVTLPTGAGKTVISSRIVQHANANKKNVLILVHRRELLFQTADKLKRFGVEHTFMLTGQLYDQSYGVAIASIPTMHSWVIRRKKEPLPPADLVIVDECAHLGTSATWQRIIERYPSAFIIGFTATPISKHGKGLGSYFDTLIQGPSIKDLTCQGYLAPVKYYVPALPDLAAVRIKAGDYVESDLEKALNKHNLIGDICENWSRIANHRKTLVFATGIKHSINISESFNKLGVRAAHIDGMTDSSERDRLIEEFASGNLMVLSSCGVFLEGFDAPQASALIFARPTKSLMLYLQAAGRGLRTCEGKADLTLLDHAGVLYEHGFLDQDFNWTLTFSDKEQKRLFRLKEERKRRTITCANCKYLYEGRLDCPECGCKPKINGRELLTYDAYLQAVTSIDYPGENQKQWYLQLLGYARSKRIKDGWAYHKFIDRFQGDKPPWSWKRYDPIPPGIEVRAWLRKRNALYFIRRKIKASYAPSTAPSAPLTNQ